MGRTLPEGTYVELVRSLFTTLLPASIMSISFIAAGIPIAETSDDLTLSVLTGLGCIAAACRLSVLLFHRKEAASAILGRRRARTIERRFATGYFMFAAVFGLFSARAFMVAPPETHSLVAALVVGYGAGVAAGLSLRPWISLPSIAIAIVPSITVLMAQGNHISITLGCILSALMAGGLQSIIARYRTVSMTVTAKRVSEKLARRDDLTGLPNRLSLRERFDAFVAAKDHAGIVAVHCLDLDRFKPVNDRYGHPIGDALLKDVSDRLSTLLRRGDFVARVGGDEFVVIQTGVSHPDEAELLARRIARSIALPYLCKGHEITIGVSVGYALSNESGDNLDVLVACADEALCRMKTEGGGIAAYRSGQSDQDNTPWEASLSAADR